MSEFINNMWREASAEQVRPFPIEPNEMSEDAIAKLTADIMEPTRATREGESQHIPKHNVGVPYMHDVVIDEMTELMRARKAIGIERYGTALQPFNTRDQGMDAFEELGDALVYLRALMYEHRYMLETIRMAMPVIYLASGMEFPGADVAEIWNRMQICDTIGLKERPADTDG